MADDAAPKEAPPALEIKDTTSTDAPKQTETQKEVEKDAEKPKEGQVEKEKSSRANDTMVSKDPALSSTAAAAAAAAARVPPQIPPSQLLGLVGASSPPPAATTKPAAAEVQTKEPTPREPSAQQQPRPLAKPPAAAAIPAKLSLSALSKKRKLSNSPPPPPVVAPPPPPPPRPPAQSTRPLVDPIVTKTVHDIMGLLQTYGPLDYAQLEFNLPPSSSTLQDVLQVMVTLGVVQIVDDEFSSFPEKRKYCMVYGQPRAHVVSSQQLVEDICDAQQEILDSQQRSVLLKQALSLSKTKLNSTNTREVLKQVLLKYPQIAQDPVYMAAFRNTHVDLAAVERERVKRSLAQKREKRVQESAASKNVSEGATKLTEQTSSPAEKKALALAAASLQQKNVADMNSS